MGQWKQRYTFNRIDQDLAPDKRDSRTHLNIVNFELFLTSRGASLQVAKGPEGFQQTIKELSPYNDLTEAYVIGQGTIDDSLYIFTTDNSNNPTGTSLDAIYRVYVTEKLLEIELVKTSSWYFSSQNPISCWGIRESSDSEKLYWIDGYNQARFTNVLDKDNLEVDYVISNPSQAMITALPYGVTSTKDAIVRYGYTLYNIRGSESKLSALTDPVAISTEGDSAKVRISGFNSTYEAWRIYRVMWESYAGAPVYDVIAEGLVPTDVNYIEIIDGGGLQVTSISVDEFVDIGSDLFVPKAIAPKKQRLFFANYTVEPFEVEEDMRAFGFTTGSINLDTPASIPADSNLEYQPHTTWGTPVLGFVDQWVNDFWFNFTLSGTETEEVFVNSTYFYIQADMISHDARVKVYDDITNQYYTEFILRGGQNVGYDRNVEKISGLSSTGYKLVIQKYNTKSMTPVQISFDWSTTVRTSIPFEVPLTTIPDIDGWVYSGVTAIDATSGIKLMSAGSGGAISDNYYYHGVGTTSITASTSAGKTTLTLGFDGELNFGGTVINTGGKAWIYLEADLTGTRQQILSDSGAIKLRQSGEAVGDGTVYTSYDSIPPDIDAINSDNSVYKYQSDGTTLGAEGAWTKFRWVEVTGGTVDHKDRVFKQGEIYRIGTVCYDKYGRYSNAYWSCDLQVPYTTTGDVGGYRNFYKLEATIKSLPTDVVGFKFVKVKREVKDMSIIAQGIVQPVMNYSVDGSPVGLYPFPTTKEIKGDGAGATGTYFDVRVGNDPTVERDFPIAGTQLSTTTLHNTDINLVYTPETFLYKTSLPINRVKLVGVQEINQTKDRTRMEFFNPSAGVSDAGTYNDIRFNMYSQWNRDPSPFCLFSDFSTPSNDEEDDAYAIWMYYRAGGTFHSCSTTADPQDKQSEVVETCKYLAIDSVVTSGSSVISNTITQTNFAGRIGQDPCNYQAEHADCYVIECESTTWAGVVNYSDFLNNTTLGTAVTDRAFPIVDLSQNLTEQYGGGTYEAKTRNIYVDASRGAVDTEVNSYITLFGDVYNGVYYLPKTTSSRIVTDGHHSSVFDYISIGLESAVNMEAANKVLRDMNGAFDGAISANLKALEVKNLLSYDTVFSTIPDSILTIAKPFNYVPVTDYLHRITVSQTKISGEVIDSWTKINLGTYMDLESQLGSITSLVRAKGRMFAFQNRGIAFISIYPDKQTVTGTGAIQLGRGSVLDNYEYISENTGTENKQCIAVYEDQVFFIDTVNKTLNSLKELELSTLKGFNSVVGDLMSSDVKNYLTSGNPSGGFVYINNRLKQVMFRFTDPARMGTLVYNYVTGAFTNTRTYSGYYFISFNNNVISAKNSQLFRHDTGVVGDYYGDAEPAQLYMLVEPIPSVDKVFDAVQVMKEGDGNFDKIKIESPTRISGTDPVPITFKSKYDVHTAHLPRVENSRDRWRERNLRLLLEYNGVSELNVDEVFVKFSIKK